MHMRFPSKEQRLYLANILADRWFFSRSIGADPQSILVVKWDEIGDMATATHVFALLRASYPSATITLLCKPFVRSLVENDPHIDRIITDIRAYDSVYHLVVELRGTWGTLLRSLWHKAKYRVGRAEIRLKHKGSQLHEIDTNFEIIQPVLKPHVIPADPALYYSEADAARVNEFLETNNIKAFAIIHAGARRKLRQWNHERFALAAQYLHDRYGLQIIFAGSGEDAQDIAAIRSQLSFPAYDFTAGFSLSQFSCLCSRASFYLGNESGPMHIASAFGTPLIGLFGPGVPYVFYPRSQRSAVLHIILSCNPCDQVHCVHPENPCISRIQVSEVLVKIDEILHK